MMRIDTLGQLRRHGYGLTIHCNGCRHYAPLDLDRAIERMGADFDTVDRRDALLAALRCGQCGGKDLDVRLTTPGGFPGVGGHRW